LPQHVTREFESFLRCGILACGFLRLRCEDCHHEKLLAFSCKKRGFCSSCGGRRMAESAAHLVDDVFPREGVRQWVLSFPMPLRFTLAKNPNIQGRCLTIVHRRSTLISARRQPSSQEESGIKSAVWESSAGQKASPARDGSEATFCFELTRSSGIPSLQARTPAPAKRWICELLQSVIPAEAGSLRVRHLPFRRKARRE
jgi:hypothetical protein